MSQPITQTELTTLPFDQRLQLVGEAVEARINRTPTTNPFEIRARLWVQWLNKNLLDVPTGRGVAV
jgi:hypothetical protein